MGRILRLGSDLKTNSIPKVETMPRRQLDFRTCAWRWSWRWYRFKCWLKEFFR
jgi:hypothetical protein